MDLTSSYGQVNSFTPQSDLSHLHRLNCWPPCCTHTQFHHPFSLFLTLFSGSLSYGSLLPIHVVLLSPAPCLVVSLFPLSSLDLVLLRDAALLYLSAFFPPRTPPYPSFFLGAMPCCLFAELGPLTLSHPTLFALCSASTAQVCVRYHSHTQVCDVQW